MPLFLKSLLASRKFWVAVFGLVQTIVFQFFPQFPRETWMAIDALCAVVIGSIAVEDANSFGSERRAKIAALRGEPIPESGEQMILAELRKADSTRGAD